VSATSAWWRLITSCVECERDPVMLRGQLTIRDYGFAWALKTTRFSGSCFLAMFRNEVFGRAVLRRGRQSLSALYLKSIITMKLTLPYCLDCPYTKPSCVCPIFTDVRGAVCVFSILPLTSAREPPNVHRRRQWSRRYCIPSNLRDPGEMEHMSKQNPRILYDHVPFLHHRTAKSKPSFYSS
jgi:hypothetical protein